MLIILPVAFLAPSWSQARAVSSCCLLSSTEQWPWHPEPWSRWWWGCCGHASNFKVICNIGTLQECPVFYKCCVDARKVLLGGWCHSDPLEFGCLVPCSPAFCWKPPWMHHHCQKWVMQLLATALLSVLLVGLDNWCVTAPAQLPDPENMDWKSCTCWMPHFQSSFTIAPFPLHKRDTTRNEHNQHHHTQLNGLSLLTAACASLVFTIMALRSLVETYNSLALYLFFHSQAFLVSYIYPHILILIKRFITYIKYMYQTIYYLM